MTVKMNEDLNRRSILKAGAMGVLAGLVGSVIAAPSADAAIRGLPGAGSFSIKIHNVHTNERFSGEYRVGNKYLPDAFEEINYVLRDFRTNDIFPIDPRTLDILHTIGEKMDAKNGFEILSGYRSPKTNAMLSRSGDGVASNSLHMVGQAVDIRLPGFSLKKLRDTARGLRAGGVGYYPKSNFVHIDTGRVRQWS